MVSEKIRQVAGDLVPQGPSNLSYLPFAREGALGAPEGEVYLTDQVKDLLLGETAR